MTFSKITAAFAASALFATAACADGHASKEAMMSKSVVEIAIGSPDHTTLVAAVQAAGLVETLSSEGPFTVFAPVNDAFAALPEGTVEGLLEPSMKDDLTKVLTCHVVGAKVMAEAVIGMVNDGGGMAQVETLGGCMLTAMLDGGMVKIKDENGGIATVVAADLVGSNGVVHVIDAVILPAM